MSCARLLREPLCLLIALGLLSCARQAQTEAVSQSVSGSPVHGGSDSATEQSGSFDVNVEALEKATRSSDGKVDLARALKEVPGYEDVFRIANQLWEGSALDFERACRDGVDRFRNVPVLRTVLTVGYCPSPSVSGAYDRPSASPGRYVGRCIDLLHRTGWVPVCAIRRQPLYGSHGILLRRKDCAIIIGHTDVNSFADITVLDAGWEDGLPEYYVSGVAQPLTSTKLLCPGCVWQSMCSAESTSSKQTATVR